MVLQYDNSGYGIVKIDDTGKPTISIRDAQGSALSEFIVDPSSMIPRLDKDFLYFNGQLLVERTVSPTEPTITTHSVLKTGSAYNFQLTSQTSQASYAVDVSAPLGWRRHVNGLQPDSQNVLAIDESHFSPNETNFVRVRIEAPQASGYSAPVSMTFDPNVNGSSSNQIRSFAISRSGTNIIVRWALNQSNGKQSKLYFRRADGTATYLLTPQALNSAVTSFTLDSQALASPCGSFWGTQIQAGVESGPGPSTDLGSSRPGEQGVQDGCGGPPPPNPQTSNRYNYVLNNPLLFTDPSGETLSVSASQSAKDSMTKLANSKMFGKELKIDAKGNATLSRTDVQGPPNPEQAAMAGLLEKVINDPANTSVTLSEGSATIVGDWSTGDIDMNDVSALGDGPGVSAIGGLSHEIAEQYRKQAQGEKSYWVAHNYANKESEKATGSRRTGESRSLVNTPGGTSGTINISHEKTGVTTQSTIHVQNSNVVKVDRK